MHISFFNLITLNIKLKLLIFKKLRNINIILIIISKLNITIFRNILINIKIINKKTLQYYRYLSKKYK